MATDQTTHRPRDNASGARGGADDGTWRDRIVELHVGRFAGRRVLV